MMIIINTNHQGDYRFGSLEHISGSDSKIVNEWTRKEHFHLLKMYEAGIPCPRPILYQKNVLLMTMIGEGDQPALALKDVVPNHPNIYRKTIVQCCHLLRWLFQLCGMIHGDFSEYNLLQAGMDDSTHFITMMNENAIE